MYLFRKKVKHKRSNHQSGNDDDELPPTYENAMQSTSSPTLPKSLEKPSASGERFSATKNAYWKPKENIQLLRANPARVKCICMRHVDTTSPLALRLNHDTVICMCGRVVSSDGSARAAPSASESPHKTALTCDCGITLQPSRPPCSSCGVHMDSCGDVYVLGESGARVLDATRRRCRCGRYVDTTMRWTFRHKLKGFSEYHYDLPRGSARCLCGRLCPDDELIQGHGSDCCEVYRVHEG